MINDPPTTSTARNQVSVCVKQLCCCAFCPLSATQWASVCKLVVSCAGLGETIGETIVHRIANQQGLILNLCASTASTGKVLELLRRISINHSQDESIPCCARIEDLPQLPARLRKYTWEAGEASNKEVEKGRR